MRADWHAGAERTTPSPFDNVRFNSGQDKRLTVYLLLDTSSSMIGPKDRPADTARPIDELNQSLQDWVTILLDQRDLHYRVELALITFGQGGVTIHKSDDYGAFLPAAKFEAPTLTAGGVTPMLEAIDTAVTLCSERKRELREQGILLYKPMMFLLTDGSPTDEAGHLLPKDQWAAAASRLRDLEANQKLLFMAAGVADVRQELLETLAPDANWKIRDGDFTAFLRFVSDSLGSGRNPIDVLRDAIRAQAVRP